MKTNNLLRTLAWGVWCVMAVLACDKEEPNTDPTVYYFTPSPDNQTKVQETLINMSDGEIIEFSAGTFSFINTLSLDGKKNITIRGAGRTKTVLDFSAQIAGAEGLKANNVEYLLMHDFSVRNVKGDGIKVKDSEHISFVALGAEWTTIDSLNGGYGLYPVSSSDILIDSCYVRGASDAGIYVGQTNKVILRNSTVENNVAGIEIENTTAADVYNNLATHNTGGILVFDLPNLPVKTGGQCRVFNNQVISNDHPNFARKGNVVGNVPSGTGIMLLASKNTEIFDNTITNNNVMGVGIINYPVLAFFDPTLTLTDTAYQAYIHTIYIHNNTFARTNVMPTSQNDIGQAIQSTFPTGNIPDIMYDGVTEQGHTTADYHICLKDNTNAAWANINALQFVNTDVAPYICTGATQPEVTIVVPHK